MENYPKTRTDNAIKNIIVGFIKQIIILILNFTKRTIFVRYIGVEYLGINGLFADVLTMLSLADLGFNTAMVYSFYKPLADNNQKKITALIHFYKKIYNIIAITIAVIGVSLVPFLNHVIKLDAEIPYIKVYYILFLLNSVISYLFVYKTTIISADQKEYIISKCALWINSFVVVFQILDIVFLQNYLLFILIQLLGTLVNNLVLSRKADKLYPYIKTNNETLNEKEKRNIYDNLKSVFIYKLSRVLLGSTDNILISVIVGTVTVGIYTNYTLITNTLICFAEIVFKSVTAGIGNLVTYGDKKKKYNVFCELQTISSMLYAMMSMCLVGMMTNFVQLWLGENYIIDKISLIALISNFYINGILFPITTYREATGLYIKTKYIMLICALVNIILSIILGYKIGLAGILFASTISRFITCFWYEPQILFRNEFEIKTHLYFRSCIFDIAIIIIGCTGIYFLSEHFKICTWIGLILKTSMIGFLSLVYILLCYIKTEGFKKLYVRIISIFMNLKGR